MALSKAKLKRFIESPTAMTTDPDYPIFAAGVDAGRLEGRKEALSFLEKEYMSDSVERGSAEGIAILNVTSKLSAYLKNLIASDGE